MVGVERGEELVHGEDVRAGEGVEQGGLAGVGVTDDGGGRHGHAQAAAALDAALLDDLGELDLEVGDAVAHEAAVLLELGFALAAHRALAALAGKVGPRAGETRERILHAGQGDLQHGLARVGAVGEHLEDDLFAVDHGQCGEFLPVALLGGREVLVEDDDIGAVGLGHVGELLGLAAAEEEGGCGLAEVDEGGADDGDAEILDQLLQLAEEFLGLALGHGVGLHADEERALELGGLVSEEISHAGDRQWVPAMAGSTGGKGFRDGRPNHSCPRNTRNPELFPCVPWATSITRRGR